MKRREIKYHNRYNAIFESDNLPIQKLAEGFHFAMNRQLVETTREIEIHLAMGDEPGKIKEQIKHSSLTHAMEVFAECYYRATGEIWSTEVNDE